nr:hypothetical protein Cry52Nrm3_p057 [Cryptomonas curvata]
MKIKKIVFFLRQKSNLFKKKGNRFILYYYMDIYIVDVIYFIQVSFNVYPVSKKSIKQYYLSNSIVVKLVNTINRILIKELNEFLFIKFFERFRNFSIVKKISKFDYKKYKNNCKIYFKN